MTSLPYTYNAETRDYAVYDGAGELVGFRRCPVEAQLLHDSVCRQQALVAAGVPAIDVAELAALFRTNKLVAAARLGMLSRPQFVVQAHAYAAYLSELRGEAVDAGAVLANWDRGLATYSIEVR